MATIKDIAKIAGVSTSTVSHVVNQTRNVSPEQVEKVERANQDRTWRRRDQIHLYPALGEGQPVSAADRRKHPESAGSHRIYAGVRGIRQGYLPSGGAEKHADGDAGFVRHHRLPR